MLATRKLFSLLPGSRTLPSTLPLSVPARVSSRSLPLGFSAPWHSTQDFSNSGLMSLSKVMPCLLEGGGNLLKSTSTALAMSETASVPARARAMWDFMNLRDVNGDKRDACPTSLRALIDPGADEADLFVGQFLDAEFVFRRGHEIVFVAEMGDVEDEHALFTFAGFNG